MNHSIYKNAKLMSFVIQEINCKKLTFPSKDEEVKIVMDVSIKADIKEDKTGLEALLKLNIKGETNDEERLISLKYSVKGIYETEYDGDDFEADFEKNSVYFIRELYVASLEYLNNTFFKMKVRFELPPHLPEGIEKNFIEK